MGSAAAGGRARGSAAGSGSRQHRPSIHTAGSSMPALSPLRRSEAGKGGGGREGLSGERLGGRDVQLVIWREESLRGEGARFEAAEAVAKDAAL